MSDRNLDVSIVLLTYNGEAYLTEVLASIFSQKTRFTYEVIAIDSGSSDQTLDILNNYPVRLIEIPNTEFGHGRTRNLGARHGVGKSIVFLTQDATPANEHWLENLVQPLLQNSNMAGVYSRQQPRSDCHPWESRDISLGAGPISALKRVDFSDPAQSETYRIHQTRFIAFSNVSSCIRKNILDRLPFAEDILMVEDQEWCKRVIEAGYSVAYESTSVVYHSHNHSIKMIFKRHFDYGASLREFVHFPMSLKAVLLYTIFEAVGDLVFILSQRGASVAALKWIAESPAVRFAMRYGLYRGLRGTTQAQMPRHSGVLSSPSGSNTPR